MIIIPSNSEFAIICADLKHYAKTDKIDGLVAIARFLKRIGCRDLLPVIREWFFDHAEFFYQDGELIPEHRKIVRNIKNYFC